MQTRYRAICKRICCRPSCLREGGCAEKRACRRPKQGQWASEGTCHAGVAGHVAQLALRRLVRPTWTAAVGQTAVSWVASATGGTFAVGNGQDSRRQTRSSCVRSEFLVISRWHLARRAGGLPHVPGVWIELMAAKPLWHKRTARRSTVAAESYWRSLTPRPCVAQVSFSHA